MFPDISEIKKTRKQYNDKMQISGIASFRDLEKLEANALKNGELSRQTKELIALGISISHSCYG